MTSKGSFYEEVTEDLPHLRPPAWTKLIPLHLHPTSFLNTYPHHHLQLLLPRHLAVISSPHHL